MRNTPIRNMHRVHHELASNRTARREAAQVAIYSFTKSGKRYAKPTLFVDAARVDETLARLRILNPGRRFEAA